MADRARCTCQCGKGARLDQTICDGVALYIFVNKVIFRKKDRMCVTYFIYPEARVQSQCELRTEKTPDDGYQ